MPGHLQEGFGCVVISCFDQLFDDKSEPFEVLKAAERGSEASKTAVQAAKQLYKESQKERKNPLPDKEEAPAPVPLKKEGIRRVGRRPDQQQPQQGEGKPIDRRQTDRRPPCERRFEKPVEEKGESGEFSVDRPIIDRPPRGRGGPGGRGRGGRGHGIGRGDGFDSRGKREFDRHSGSDQAGAKHEDKRGGSGSHNWGNVKDELSKLDQSTVTKEAPEAEEQPVVLTQLLKLRILKQLLQIKKENKEKDCQSYLSHLWTEFYLILVEKANTNQQNISQSTIWTNLGFLSWLKQLLEE
uniref:Hyaluronan/mRNA-binding protein domain-containing protein n=1 Tax=Leptobrachium leishanense TaxID=445787 RepID=A0A8C5QKT9_9ANUR